MAGKGRKLKVFQAQFGFYDTIVAVPSRAAALKVWGTHQNLFKDGQATEITEEAAVAAALAHPETPLRRAVGSRGAFELDPKELPKVPDAPARKASAAGSVHRKTSSPPKPPADRTRLEAAEAALKRLDQARKAEEAHLRKRRDELDAQIADAQSAYAASRKSVTAKIVDARKAYREAGGRD